MLKRWIINQLNDEQQKCKTELETEFKVKNDPLIAPAICTLLAARGIKNAAEARSFFRPDLNELHDPFLMKDMDKAVARLNRAIGDKEKILVYGDYDVDGTTAVALVYKFLRNNFTSNIDFYIPNRDKEGYGVSYQGIDYAVNNGVKLIIVLDCGIKAIEKVEYAKQHGVEIIICDHHNPDNKLPDAVAVLDAKRADNTYPYEHLSGCGVGFKFMQAFAQNNHIPFDNLAQLMDLLAVSIASDIVPITGENRVLMYHGLQRLNKTPSLGLRAIMRTCGLWPQESYDKSKNKMAVSTPEIVFKVGPRINAAGRMKDGREVVELLVASDEDFASARAEEIDEYNQNRKDEDKGTTEKASEIIRAHTSIQARDSIVVYGEDWKKGVIGIVASRLSEKFYRPTVVLTLSNNLYTGSARSIVGFDIYSAIDSCRDLLENFGGHTYAAGLCMKKENVKLFAERFESYVKENITEEQKTPQVEIDTEISFAEITQTFYNIIQKFAPFGPENMKPVFVTRNVVSCFTTDHNGNNVCSSRRVGKTAADEFGKPMKPQHLRVELVDPETGIKQVGIGFGLADAAYTDDNGKEVVVDYAKELAAGHPVDICYTIEENDFRGTKSLQLVLRDIKKSSKITE